jgi:hypothetical protein
VAVLGARAARWGRAEADAGVVDQTMQRPKAPSDVLDECPDLGDGGQIGDRDLAATDALDRRRGPLAAAPVDDHPRAPMPQPPGQLLPDPRRRPRHQHGAIHATILHRARVSLPAAPEQLDWEAWFKLQLTSAPDRESGAPSRLCQKSQGWYGDPKRCHGQKR